MSKKESPDATPGPSQSRKSDSSTWRRVYTSDSGKLSLDAVYVLKMFDAIDDAPLTLHEKAALKVLVRFANPTDAHVEWNPIAWPTEATLAGKSGVGRTKLVSEVLPTLAGLNYIERCYRTRAGELTNEKRDRNGQWNRCGYVLHLETLEVLAEMADEERVHHQRVTLARRTQERPRRPAPCSSREHGPCSESTPSRVRAANTGRVHAANTIELTPPNLGNESYNHRNATAIATPTPTNTGENRINPSTDGERSDSGPSQEQTYIAPCSPREHGGESGADTCSGYSPEAAARLAAALDGFNARQTHTADEVAVAEAHARDARDITPEDDAEL